MLNWSCALGHHFLGIWPLGANPGARGCQSAWLMRHNRRDSPKGEGLAQDQLGERVVKSGVTPVGLCSPYTSGRSYVILSSRFDASDLTEKLKHRQESK